MRKVMTHRAGVHTTIGMLLRPHLERIESSPLGSRLVRGAIWGVVGAIISRGLALLASVLVARLLGRDRFGELAALQSTVGMFGVFAGFGMGLTATKHIAEFRERDPTRTGRVIALSSVVAWITSAAMAGMLFGLAPYLATNTLNAPHLASLMRLAGLLLLLTGVNGAQIGVLTGFEAFGTIARVNLIGGVLSFPLILCGVYWGHLAGALWGLIAAQGMTCALTYLAIRTETRRSHIAISVVDCWQERQILWSFSLPVVLTGAIVGPVNWLCTALLVNQPNGYAEMGLFNAVFRMKQLPEMVLIALLAPLLPILSEQHGGHDTSGYGKTLFTAYTLSFAVMVPFAIMFVAVPDLLTAPYGPGYESQAAVVQWLLVHSLVIGMAMPMTSVLASTRRMWWGLAYNVSWAVVYVLLSTVLVPRYRACGLAASFALSYAITAVPTVLYIRGRDRCVHGPFPLLSTAVVGLLLFVLSALASCFIGFWGGFLATAIAIGSGLLLILRRYRAHGGAL
jgi:O-antigen/teichoic acid export membrane protein